MMISLFGRNMDKGKGREHVWGGRGKCIPLQINNQMMKSASSACQ